MRNIQSLKAGRCCQNPGQKKYPIKMANTRSKSTRSRSKSPSCSTPSSTSKSKPKKSTTTQSPLFPHGLYPTVALTDTVNALAHYWAAWICFGGGKNEAGWGFLTVAFAASVGKSMQQDDRGGGVDKTAVELCIMQ